MEELLEKVKNGDEESYEKVVKLIHKDLFNIAMAKLLNEDDAHDAVQETLIKVYENSKEVKDLKSIKSWIVKILINECNNIYRIRKRKLNLIAKLEHNPEIRENDLDKIENKFLTESLLKKLNEKERIILFLHYENDYTTQAISELLGMKENTVKSIVRRAKEKLNDNKNNHISKFSIILIMAILIGSSITFAGRIINTLKEKIIISTKYSVKAVDDAVANNYFKEVNSDFVYSNEIGIKVDKISMDDKFIYLSCLLDFGKDNIIKDFDFEKYIICDDMSNVLAVSISEDIKNIYSSDYSSSGMVYSTKVFDEENAIWKYDMVFQAVYNKNYPVSKKINVDIEGIDVINSDKENITGKWNFDIDLDNKFITRTSEYYLYESNEKIKNITAKLNDLSLELIIEMNNNINEDVLDTNDLVLLDENGDAIETFERVINIYSKKITYVCDIGKYSQNIDKLSLYLRYNYGADKYIDIELEKP